ncbi:RNA repair domain-containing protein [Saccharothrix texasensis]|uniref:Endonuclease/exonuclease/phosphatase family metal-dependent hydrolase n=1 Tax=Saccharothrix texasensis TaxID=103734 RepID=A0A3N1H0Y6_9PSEU|nr:RNA repair domain-containing protein [Saccharothrix texasensis]ROP36046.1 endonuclease/exonuclease/phosphatase family metal-dependent hydrolase [Saccharothrix texasensis]
MRTSEEVYHQVRWDPRFDPARFVLGVQQRGARPERVALPAFTPGGEVPWHRVLFVEADGEVVWDRATGLDRVGESGAGRVRAPRRLRAPVFTASTPHAWDPLHGWTPTRTPSAPREVVPPEQRPPTTVLTWNVLWDRYDSDRIDTARRRPLLLGELAVADADVIALQEVEPDLLAALLAQPWVRARYTLDVDPTGPDVDRTGLLVLSRLPVLEAARFPLGAHKAVGAIVVETGDGPLVVAATHLTSDHTANGSAKRRAQLGRVAEAFAGVVGDVVLVGDFNDGSRRPAAALGMRDAWLQARDDEPPTFDPVVNPLAAVSSLTGRRSRLDRVFLRGGLWCAGAELVGDRPVDGLFASDHYGVLARLTPAGPAAGALDPSPTPRTAVVWLPGPWGDVERARQEHDRRSDHRPPHVTLLSGFVPESDFDRAVPLLAEAVADVPPFPVRVDGVPQSGRGVVRLDPAAAGRTPWAALHDAVRRPFPACRTGGDFTPHLTVGGSAQAARTIGARSDRVDEVVLLSRRGDGPMLPRAAIALGTGEVRWFEEPATAPGPSLDAVADRVTRALSAVLDVVHVVGSRRMGCGLPDADLDLVAEVARPAAVAGRVASALPGAVVRPVVGARSPGVRLVVDGLGVDLAVAAGDGVAVSAVGDAEAVTAAVAGRQEDFARLARAVKAWARARGLDSAPFGGVPGLGWSVLAARTVREWDGPDLLAGFFGTWAAWDWRDPIGVTTAPGRTGAPVTIMTPAAPVRSCTEQVGPGFRDLLTAELYRAWEIVSAGAPGLTAPPDAHRTHAAWALLTVPHEVVGPVRGRVRALLTALEVAGTPDAHAWPRPVERTADAVRYAIGLGRRPVSAAVLADVVASWRSGLRGVDVVRVGNGDVPTLR